MVWLKKKPWLLHFHLFVPHTIWSKRMEFSILPQILKATAYINLAALCPHVSFLLYACNIFHKFSTAQWQTERGLCNQVPVAGLRWTQLKCQPDSRSPLSRSKHQRKRNYGIDMELEKWWTGWPLLAFTSAGVKSKTEVLAEDRRQHLSDPVPR